MVIWQKERIAPIILLWWELSCENGGVFLGIEFFINFFQKLPIFRMFLAELPWALISILEACYVEVGLPANILLIESSRSSLAAVFDLLMIFGTEYSVSTCEFKDMEATEKIINDVHPDLIIIDDLLPKSH